MPDSDVCAYCAVTALTRSEKPEHPIPASLGASFLVRTVCNRCNEWAGEHIDSPFLSDDLLRVYRSAAGQADPRRAVKRKFASPLLRGYTADGDFVWFDHKTRRPVMGSRIIDLGGGRYQIRAGSEGEARRLMEKVERRAAAEGKAIHLETEERTRSHPQIQTTISADALVWRREAAKIGLATASCVYPPPWRLSSDAQILRDWMHNRDPRASDGTAPLLIPTQLGGLARLVRTDEHLLYFMRGQDGTTYLTTVLFGSALFAVPVNCDRDVAIPTQAWRLDWRHPRRDGSTTWDELVRDVTTRAIPPQ